MEPHCDRRSRARALSALFGAGALLSTAVLLLPGWEGLHVAGIGATAAVAGSGALALYVFAERFSRAWIHTMTLSGTVLIGACQVLAGGGPPTAMYAMLYIWVALHCAMFFARTVVAAHLVGATAAHAAALLWLGETGAMAPQLTLTLGTQLAAAAVVGTLATQQRRLADTDALTGLANRRTATRALGWSLERSRREPSSPTCVAMLDLDGFKSVNDRHGHAVGDQVLADVAALWSSEVRTVDTLARTGGDEFLLVLTGCDLDEAEEAVHRLLGRTGALVDASGGLACWDGSESSDELLRRVDQALYAAKTEGPLVVARTAEGAVRH